MLKGAIVVVRGMVYNSLPKSQAVGPPNVKQTAYVHMSYQSSRYLSPSPIRNAAYDGWTPRER